MQDNDSVRHFVHGQIIHSESEGVRCKFIIVDGFQHEITSVLHDGENGFVLRTEQKQQTAFPRRWRRTSASAERVIVDNIEDGVHRYADIVKYITATFG